MEAIRLGPNSPLRSKSRKLKLGFTESQMQKKAIELLVGDRRTTFGMIERFPVLALLYAIPNQRASKGEVGRMRGEGALDGMPDLCLPVVRYIEEHFEPIALGALYIEVKLEGENPRENQRRVIALLREHNAVVVCRSVEAITEVCKTWIVGGCDEIEAMLRKYRN